MNKKRTAYFALALSVAALAAAFYVWSASRESAEVLGEAAKNPALIEITNFGE